MILKIPRLLSVTVLVLTVCLAASPAVALAVGNSEKDGPKSADSQGESNSQRSRLTEGKLKACQAKEKALRNRVNQTTRMATSMQAKFDAIVQRIKTYYTSKVVPSGKTVANYDSLLADIESKKAAVGTALEKAQNSAKDFTCSGEAPKEKLEQYRANMQAVKTALKEYRTSIKNLIVAVRSVVSTTE